MPATNFNWADQIKQANESTASFTPLEAGVYNFSIEKPEVKTFPNGNSVVNFRAKVVDGPRKGGSVFDNMDPYNTDPKFAFRVKAFLDLVVAVGYNHEWLIQHEPTLEQIAQAMEGREFSAEVHYRDNARKDNQGRPYADLRNYTTKGAVAASAAPQGAPAAQPVAAAPQAQAQPAVAAQPQGGAPWGVPTPDQAQPAPAAQPAAPAQDAGPGNPWG